MHVLVDSIVLGNIVHHSDHALTFTSIRVAVATFIVHHDIVVMNVAQLLARVDAVVHGAVEFQLEAPSACGATLAIR